MARRIFDVIEAPTMGPEDLVVRVPPTGPGDFRLGSQLIVRESQAAVFFRDGKALDVLGPGRHTLTTANIPVLIEFPSLAEAHAWYESDEYAPLLKLRLAAAHAVFMETDLHDFVE